MSDYVKSCWKVQENENADVGGVRSNEEVICALDNSIPGTVM